MKIKSYKLASLKLLIFLLLLGACSQSGARAPEQEDSPFDNVTPSIVVRTATPLSNATPESQGRDQDSTTNQQSTQGNLQSPTPTPPMSQTQPTPEMQVTPQETPVVEIVASPTTTAVPQPEEPAGHVKSKFLPTDYSPELYLFDANGDFIPDLFLDGTKEDEGNPASMKPVLNIYLGNGDGTVGTEEFLARYGLISLPDIQMEIESNRRKFFSDLNGDGEIDFVLEPWSDDANESVILQAFMGHGNGMFSSKAAYTFPRRIQFYSIGSMSGASHDDLLIWAYNGGVGGDYVVLDGVGDGTFVDSGLSLDVGQVGFGVMDFGDIDGDDLPDYVATYSLPRHAGQDGRSWISIRHQNMDGTFEDLRMFEIVYPFDAGNDFKSGDLIFLTTDSAKIADVDNDGTQDIVGITFDPIINEFAVTLLRGVGDHAFEVQRSLFPIEISEPGYIRPADFNMDGLTDLVLMGEAEFALHLGDGEGDFESPIVIRKEGLSTLFRVIDMNNNGILDIAYLSATELLVVLDPVMP